MNTTQPNSHHLKPGDSPSESSRLSLEELLHRVNLLAAHYDYGRVKVLPDISEEAKAVLSHVRVAVVDDLEGILAAVGIDLPKLFFSETARMQPSISWFQIIPRYSGDSCCYKRLSQRLA